MVQKAIWVLANGARAGILARVKTEGFDICHGEGLTLSMVQETIWLLYQIPHP